MTNNDAPVDSSADKTPAGLSAPTKNLVDALGRYRQGDLLGDVTAIAVTGDDGQPATYPTPSGVVLISQTCDIVQTTREAVAVAPAAVLADTAAAADARNGKRPSLVHLPDIGANAFANLEIVGSISKHYLVQQSSTHGVSNDHDIRHLGQVIGRKWARFAFPDDIVAWLEPLRTVLASKALRPNSPEGKALTSIVELRVEANPGWTTPGPQQITVVIVLKPGVMPFFDEASMPDLPDELARWLYDDTLAVAQSAPDIAARLSASRDPIEQYFLWDALAQAWISKCRPTGKQPPSVHSAVDSIVSEIVSSDEYTLDRFQASEQLDLDHLSDPLPRAPTSHTVTDPAAG